MGEDATSAPGAMNRHPESAAHLRDNAATMGHAGHDVPAPSIPTNLGHYTIIRTLGEGGMGTVFEAEQASPKRTVALKVIRPGYLSSDLLRRFGQEAQVLGRLQHPGIAQIYEAGTVYDARSQPVPYFAMEFIRGVSLTEYVTAHKLGTRARLDLIAQVCDAVEHAHQKGVIHRDLKPGNILVDQSGRPKILDFGVARATDSDMQQTSMRTDIGQLVGTVPYMSPEQISGDSADLDTRSDVYSLGVIMFEVLVGRLPYDVGRKMVLEAARIIRDNEPTRLSSVNRTLRGDVETIVSKALQKERGRRYQSAESLGADIRRYLNDEPIAARPASTWYQTSKFARRNRGLVAGLAIAFLCLATGLVFSLRSRNEAVAARADAEAFVTLMIDKIRGKYAEVGRLDALADVAGSVREYYSRRGESSLDPEQLLMLGKSLQLAGEAALGSGNIAGARDAFTEQRHLLADLVKRHPADGRFIKALGAAHFYMGEIARRGSDLDGAAREWAAYLEAARSLVGLDPANPEWQLELAYAHSNFVQLYSERGQPDRALASLRTALETKRRLVLLDPSNAEYSLSLANSLTQLANALESTKDLNGAEGAALEALEILGAVVDHRPGDADARFRLAVVHVHIGELRLKAARPEEALASFRAMQDAARRLIEIDPSNGDWQRQMAVGHRLAARAELAIGDSAGAGLDLAASRRILESLVKRDSRNLRWRFDLVSTERETSRLAAHDGDRQECREALRRARSIIQGASVAPDDAAAVADITIRLASLDLAEGIAAQSAGQADDARELWSAAVSKLEPLSGGGEHDVLEMLAHALLLLGRRGEAEARLARLQALGGTPSDEVIALVSGASSGS